MLARVLNRNPRTRYRIRSMIRSNIWITIARLGIWRPTCDGRWGDELASDLAANFDLATTKQVFRLGRGTRGVGISIEEFPVGGVHRVEIIQVGQVYVYLDDAIFGEV